MMRQHVSEKWYLAPFTNGAKNSARIEINGANRDAQAPNGAVRTCPRACEGSAWPHLAVRW